MIPARIDAVTLAVSDVERSATFYRDVMGFSELRRSPEIAKFELQNCEMTLISRDVLLEETHLTAFPAGHGPVTFAVSVARDDVDVHMKRLADAGVHVVAEAEEQAAWASHRLRRRPRRAHLGSHREVLSTALVRKPTSSWDYSTSDVSSTWETRCV